LNNHSIGIAFDRDTNTREVFAHEIDSAAHKCLYLMDKFGIKKDGILTHQMIAPGRKNDCSEGTWHQVLERIDELLSQP
jgi:N-acetyl-anhydromuramyl-L-alanine amidase AmpD